MSSYPIFQNVVPIVFLFVSLLILCEIGFRNGRKRRAEGGSGATTGIADLLGPVLTLLALLLGFSVSIAENHAAARRDFSTEEANAIGSAFLRTKLVALPEQQEIGDILQRYASARRLFYEEAAGKKDGRAGEESMKRLQGDLWAKAATLGARTPQLITTGLLLDSINRVIDLEESQRIALKTQIHPSIVALLAFGSIVAMGMVGYQLGTASSRHLFWTSTLSLLLASTLLAILDLDRSQRGFIRTQNESLDRIFATKVAH